MAEESGIVLNLEATAFDAGVASGVAVQNNALSILTMGVSGENEPNAAIPPKNGRT
jgi:hypothetical protein